MFEKFTDKARHVIINAREEAERLRHGFLGTEHMLLGLIREREGMAVTVLRNVGLSLEQIQFEVERNLLKSEGSSLIEEIPFSLRAKKVLELAVEEARLLGQSYIGTEHLLLGLIKEREGNTAKLLKKLGIDLRTTRKEIISLLKLASPNIEKDDKDTPTLNEYGRDLTQLARKNKLDPVIGRENEIERLIQILSRRTKNNPVLIGEPGVGKTAIVEGLAQRIISNDVPKILFDKRVVALDLGSIVAGTKYRGQFEERLKTILNEIIKSSDIIIFIDELHTLVGAGAAEGSIDASNMLKPALARGEIQCIGATTLNEYRKYIEKDGALERRFQTIIVQPPSIDETIKIIKGLRGRYEAHHKVNILDEAVEAAVKLSSRYISDRFLPDKAIDVIDEAGSRARLKKATFPPQIKDLSLQLERAAQGKTIAIKMQEFEKAANLRDQEEKLKEKLEILKQDWEEKQEKIEPVVTEDEIAVILSKITGIPLQRLEEKESERLLHLEDELHNMIIGQKEAITAVSKSIRRSRVGLKHPYRPIGSFIFLGPTGVGKTEFARALAKVLFDNENSLIRIDMSEYMEKFNVSRLTGAPPGYVGHEEGGQLTERVRRKPYSIVLLDEIEKAHPDIFNILLQVLDNGQLTDSYGRIVDFRNTVIIITSNLGARFIEKNTTVGFQKDSYKNRNRKMKDKVLEELKKTFNPEFLNRIDDIVVFNSLDKNHIGQIIDLLLLELNQHLANRDLYIKIDNSAKEWLIEKGFNPAYGARHLRRIIQQNIEDPLSEEILKGDFQDAGEITVEVKEGALKFDAKTTVLKGK